MLKKENKNFSSFPVDNKVSIVAYATYFVIALCFLFVRLLTSTSIFDGANDKLVSGIFSFIIQVLLMFVLPLYFFSRFNKIGVRDTTTFFGYKKIDAKCWGYALILGIIVFFLNSYISSFFVDFLRFFGYRQSGSEITSYSFPTLLFNLFFGALLPAICEETTHRGLILKSSLGLGQSKAIVLSALLFGLVHMNISQCFYAIIIGLFLGHLAIKSDSIYPCMAIHFVNNALCSISTYLTFNFPSFNNFLSKVTSLSGSYAILGIIFSIIFIIMLAVGLVYFSRKLIARSHDYRLVSIERQMRKNILQCTKLVREMERRGETQEKIEFNIGKLVVKQNRKQDFLSSIELNKFLDSKNNEEQEYDIDFYTITFMLCSFAIGICATIFTFLWGGII